MKQMHTLSANVKWISTKNDQMWSNKMIEISNKNMEKQNDKCNVWKFC